MSIQTVSCVEFLSIVEGSNRGRFSALSVYNEVSLTGGKKCPYYGTMKAQTVSGRLGESFRKLLERNMKRQNVAYDALTIGERVWGTKHGHNVITHTLASGERMVYVVFAATSYTNTIYSHNGATIDASVLKDWMTKKTETKVNYEIDGEKKSKNILLDAKFSQYRLDSIKGFRINKNNFLLDCSDIQEAFNLF